MKLRHPCWFVFAAAVALLVPGLCAQAQFRLDLPDLAAKADQVSDVSLDGPVLQMGLAFLSHHDGKDGGMSAQDRDLLSRLKGIYVKSFEFKHDGDITSADLAPTRNRLRALGWTRIVSVKGKSDAENDEVYLLTGSGGAIEGLTVISLQRRELDLVNIVGRIQPAEILSLGGHLHIPGLEMASPAKRDH